MMIDKYKEKVFVFYLLVVGKVFMLVEYVSGKYVDVFDVWGKLIDFYELVIV